MRSFSCVRVCDIFPGFSMWLLAGGERRLAASCGEQEREEVV